MNACSRWGWNQFVTDWREVVNDRPSTYVDINTPNDTHAEIAIAAAKAGKAVLCEKPLAMDVKQARQMVDAVKKAGVVNMVCHNYRRIPAIVLAKKMIAAGELAGFTTIAPATRRIGLLIRASHSSGGCRARLPARVRTVISIAHIIDLGRYLIGEFTEVCGQMETFIKERPLPGESSKKAKSRSTTRSCHRSFENGALANLEATRFALGRKNGIQIEINGSKGSLVFDLEDMNRLKYYNEADPDDRRGFRDILVTQGGGVHPLCRQLVAAGSHYRLRAHVRPYHSPTLSMRSQTNVLFNDI